MGCGASSSNQVNKNAVQAAPQNQNFPVNAQGFQASPNRNRYNQKENQPVGMTPFQKSPTKQNAKGSGQRGNMNNENVRLMQQRDSAETLPSHPNQNYRGLVEVSNFGDLLNEDEENQNVTFANGELSPIKAESANRLTRQQRSELINLRTFEQEIGKRYGDTSAMNKKVQVVRVRRQKTTLFNWPDSGQLEVQTISYRIVYSHAIKGFRTVKSKDQYITSLLSWFKDEDEDLYEFSLKDFLCTNLRSGNHLDLNTPEIYFQVDTDGKFLGIRDLEKFINNLISVQNTGYFTAQKRNELKRRIAFETERTWNEMVQQWVSIHLPDNQDLIIGKSFQFGHECVLLNQVTSSNEMDIRNKLKYKLMDNQSYYKILGSSKMMKDKFKKWELHKDSKPKRWEYDGEQYMPHRNMRLNFIFTEKDEAMTTLADPTAIRPIITNSQSSRKIVFEVNRDTYIDIEFEAKMSIYQWPDMPRLQNDQFLIMEMVKFQDSCNQAFGDLMREISTVSRIPLAYRISTPHTNRSQNETLPETMVDLGQNPY